MRLGREILSWRPDGLVPVPLHPAREKKRGYNQAALLAEEMGKCLNIPGIFRAGGKKPEYLSPEGIGRRSAPN